MADLPLTGVRVLELSSYFVGPYTTRLLADAGADVLKIEPPTTGDPARHEGPFFHDEPDLEKSGVFLFLNTNKRSVTLNLESNRGQQIVRDLIKETDIIVESFPPGYLDKLGLSYKTLSEINPNLVMVSITNYGQNGKYKDYQGVDLTLWAMGGAMISSGHIDEYPLKLAGRIASFHVGSCVAAATMTAYWNALLSDEGEQVDISFYESWMGSIDRRTRDLLVHAYTGEQSQRAFPSSRLASGAYPCKDGYFHFSNGGRRFLDRLLPMMGLEHLANEPPWNDPVALVQPESAQEFDAIFIPWLLEYTKQELRDMCQEAGVLGAPVNTVEDIVNDRHFIEREYWQTIDHPATGPLSYPGFNVRFHGIERPNRTPAPLLGAHTNGVMEHLGYSPEEIGLLRHQGVI